MKIKPEELEANGYYQMDALGHNDLVPFVRTYLKKPTPVSIVFTIINSLFVVAIAFWFWKCNTSDSFSIADSITHLSYGIALAFTLIPMHEYIHVLAYKSQGAKQTSYDANIRKFYFMALAHKFVANKREFRVVALAPIVVISVCLIVLLFFTDQLWTFTVLGVLLTHTAFTSGDFGLLSYFDFHRDKDVVTFDDVENKISYFYGKMK